jgi:glycerate dehydrogenase
MNLVVLDGYTVDPGDNPFDALKRFGELTVYERTAAESVAARAKEADILLTSKVRLTEELLAQLPKLRFIVELATGVDNIDTVAAGRRGIPVANVPDYSSPAVAQHTLALLLALTNRVAEHAALVASGEWIASPDFAFWRHPLTELSGKRMGLVGLGRIGSRVAALAHGLGMEVVAHSPRWRELPECVPVRWLPQEELFATADVVSLHCPLTSENRGFVDRRLLSTMKREALLINTARGALINEHDLAMALNSGVIAGAALDVLAQEPMAADNPLRTAKNCLITPHLAWATLAARRRLMATVVANVDGFASGVPVNVVNAQHLSK